MAERQRFKFRINGAEGENKEMEKEQPAQGQVAERVRRVEEKKRKRISCLLKSNIYQDKKLKKIRRTIIPRKKWNPCRKASCNSGSSRTCQ